MALWDLPRKPRLLIVEDDYDLADLLQFQLGYCQGAEVDVSAWGNPAKELCRHNEYDTLLIDPTLPDMDGWELLPQLRSAYIDAPVLLLLPPPEGCRLRPPCWPGIVDELTKPFPFAHLAEIIRYLLGHRKLQLARPWVTVESVRRVMQPAPAPETRSSEGEDLSRAEIRRLLVDTFTPEELRRFCTEHLKFQPIAAHLSPAYSLHDMADRIIDYCRAQWLCPTLLKEICGENLDQWQRQQQELWLRRARNRYATGELEPD
jgi:DNA-binding response OmpR family regulator